MHLTKLAFILIPLLIVYFFLSTNFLLAMPRIWPDEAYLADIALNVTTGTQGGTNLWGNTIIGIKKSLYWYPPVYLYTLGYWFKLFGFSIYNQRILSIIFGGIFLLIFYLYSKTFLINLSNFKKHIILVPMLFFLIADNVFLKATRIGRGEIVVLVFVILSMYIIKIVENTQRKRSFFYSLIGLLLALAFLTHLLSIFLILPIGFSILFSGKLKTLSHQYIYLVVFFLIPILLWINSIYPNYYIFLKQLSLQNHFRVLVDPYIESVFKYSSLEQKLAFSIYIILSLSFLLFSFIDRSKKYLLIVTMLVLSWIIYIFGKLEWYSVYPVVFLYLTTSILIYKLLLKIEQKSKLFLFLGIVTSLLIVSLYILNMTIYIKEFQFNKQHSNLYLNFGEEVKNIIPAQKTIYLSTTPDLYFNLKGRNTLYEFPGVNPRIKEYIDLLNDSDYIVINFHLEQMFIGNVLSQYIELNQKNEYIVGDLNLYQAQIIELKPKNQRLNP